MALPDPKTSPATAPGGTGSTEPSPLRPYAAFEAIPNDEFKARQAKGRAAYIKILVDEMDWPEIVE